MEIAKIVINGGSQVVLLPKNYKFDTDEVVVNRVGNVVMLIPKDDRWQSTLGSLDMFTEDFLKEEFESLPLEERKVHE